MEGFPADGVTEAHYTSTDARCAKGACSRGLMVPLTRLGTASANYFLRVDRCENRKGMCYLESLLVDKYFATFSAFHSSAGWRLMRCTMSGLFGNSNSGW